MKSIIISILIFNVFLYYPCANAQSTKLESNLELKSINSLRDTKTKIDSQIKNNNQIIVLVKLFNKPGLYKVVDNKFPDDIEITYNILKNSSGEIIWASEIPTIEIGERFVAFSQYFNEKGKTFAFERYSNGYSLCGFIYETKEKYFDDNFKLLDIDYKAVDKDNNKIDTNNCIISKYQYKVIPKVDEYLRIKNINIFESNEKSINNTKPFSGFGNNNGEGIGYGVANDTKENTREKIPIVNRERLNNIHSLPKSPNNTSYQITFKLFINPEGKVVRAEVVRDKTTTNNQSLINEIETLIKKEIRYKEKQINKIEISYYTVTLKP